MQKEKHNKPWNPPKTLLSLQATSPAFYCPLVTTFCLYLHTHPSKSQSCFTTMFYSKLFILLKVTNDLPVSNEMALPTFIINHAFLKLSCHHDIHFLILFTSELPLYKALFPAHLVRHRNKANRSSSCSSTTEREMHFREGVGYVWGPEWLEWALMEVKREKAESESDTDLVGNISLPS